MQDNVTVPSVPHFEPFSKRLNTLAAATHALARGQDPELTQNVTRDMVNATKHDNAARLFRREIGYAILDCTDSGTLMCVPELDPRLAEARGATHEALKHVEKLISCLPASDKALKDGSNWHGMLSKLIKAANQHRLSFDQIREILCRYIQGTEVFVASMTAFIERPDLVSTLRRLSKARCKQVTKAEVLKQIRSWRLDSRSVHASLHTLVLYFGTCNPDLTSPEVEKKVVAYLRETAKLPTEALELVDEHQRTFDDNEPPTFDTMQALLVSYFDRKGEKSRNAHHEDEY